MSNKSFSQAQAGMRISFFRSMRGTLLLLFLAVALIPLITVGTLAYTQAKIALETEATNKLVAVRDIKADQIETYFATIEGQVRTLSKDLMIIQAMGDFKQSFHSLDEDLNLDSSEIQRRETVVRGYYQSEYLARLNPNLDAPASVDTYWPADVNTRLAQYLYLANNPNPTGSKENLDDAADGSRYSQHHRTYHPIIRDYLREFGYYDIFLVDSETGHIVYTVFKEVDFTTSLLTGPYKNTNFARAFQAANAATDPDFVYLADFEPYHPSYNAPASFIASPIFDGSKKVGVLLFQMPIDRINAIMQERAGMGESGETYLVGHDKLMRSDSRFEENTILRREIDTVTANKALNGQAGVEVVPDYRDISVLSAYKPLNIAGVKWAILSEIDEVEAFATVQQMLMVMLTIMGVGAVIVAVVAIFVANSISKPVQVVAQTATQLADQDLPQLVQGIQAVAQGDLTTSFQLKPRFVDIHSRNEVGLMAQAFNSMSEALDVVGDNFTQMLLNLRSLVGHVQEGADQVASASQQLNASAEQAGQASQQVASISQQVTDGTTQQTRSITETTTNVEQMARGAEGIARGAQEQAQGVQKTSDLIDEMVDIVDQVRQVADSATGANSKVTQAARHGVSAVEQTGQGMDTIRTRTADAVEKVKEMGNRSKEIGRIVETIDDIADKTDMLALNAAVEAARAGEHGRGFAVVADQVRKLSEDSKNATRDIGDLIERVQETVDEAIAAMESTATEVDNGTRLAGDTTQSLQEILQAAEAAAEMAEQIGEAVGQLKHKSEGVVTAVSSVSTVVEENTAAAEEMATSSQGITAAMEGVASVAEENSAAIEEVNASAEEMSAQVEEVVASAEELSALAEELREATAQFRVDGTDWSEPERPVSRPKAARTPEVARTPISEQQPEPVPALAGQDNSRDVEPQ